SLYSSSPVFHDKIRGHKGLWKKAVNAARDFLKIREKINPNFRVNMQTIICKENYTDFPNLIQLAYTLGFCSITFSYLEGDYQEKKYLLDKEQIISFKNRIIPEAMQVIKHSYTDKWAKRMAVSAVKSIYSEKRVSLEKYAAGIYRHPVPCQIPSFFSIVLANGDVHPCNMVEYTHSPVIGNLHSKSFKEMWEGQKWETFRKEGFDFCRFCPVPIQAIIPIHRRPDYAWAQYGIQHTVLKSIYPHIKKFVLSNRYLLNTIRKR
ncbi:MAG: SPASM domain-containing protein, partial [Desulfobacterales bacterium]|nr:SPASM domain-containing protein [Desulfobacterales bacterium]